MAPAVHILAADDNELNRTILIKQLDKLGYTADVVAGGAEAVAACERRPYALVFMDVHMAGMDGYQATRAIRSRQDADQAAGQPADQPARPRVPIIAITANEALEEQERCLDAGMDDFLPKPITLGELARRLVRWGAHHWADAGDDDSSRPVLAAGAADRLRELERASGCPGLAAELTEDFIEQASARVRRLEKALARGQHAKADKECFALRMYSRGVGALRLEAVARALARAATPDERAELAEQATDQIAALAEALAHLR